MKLMKRMAVLALVVLALGGCTKSSISDETPAMEEGPAGEEFDPAKMEEEEDETLPREENFLIDENPEPVSLYDWDQIRYESGDLFSDTDTYPQAVRLDFTSSEEEMTVDLNWIVKNDTDKGQAEEYASMLVKKFNDLAAIQSADLEMSSADSFGGLWNDFALSVKITTEGGSTLLEKSYKAGDKIDLVSVEEEAGPGPEIVEENVPKKLDEKKK